MASVLQVLFALPPFKTRYYDVFRSHASACDVLLPSNCLDCQMNKIAHGLISGRYAVPDPDIPQLVNESTEKDLRVCPVFQKGVPPMMFKALVGRGHPEFSTMRQQDAEEFLRHIFELIQRHAHQRRNAAPALSGAHQDDGMNDLDPTSIFRFEVEQKLECLSCRGVRYSTEEQNILSIPIPAVPVIKETHTSGCEDTVATGVAYQPVTLTQCLQKFTMPNTVEYTCPRCKNKTSALKSVPRTLQPANH